MDKAPKSTSNIVSKELSRTKVVDPYFTQVPQGTFTVINNNTPDEVRGLYTTGLHECRLFGVIDPDNSNNFALGHLDALTDFTKGHNLDTIFNMVSGSDRLQHLDYS